MKRIKKTYKTLAQAERYQNRLYGKYSSVQLVSFPRFSEDGQYIWEVS
jgi:hypothetical protein